MPQLGWRACGLPATDCSLPPRPPRPPACLQRRSAPRCWAARRSTFLAPLWCWACRARARVPPSTACWGRSSPRATARPARSAPLRAAILRAHAGGAGPVAALEQAVASCGGTSSPVLCGPARPPPCAVQVEVIRGEVGGIPLTFIDTPGLEPSAGAVGANLRKLHAGARRRAAASGHAPRACRRACSCPTQAPAAAVLQPRLADHHVPCGGAHLCAYLRASIPPHLCSQARVQQAQAAGGAVRRPPGRGAPRPG